MSFGVKWFSVLLTFSLLLRLPSKVLLINLKKKILELILLLSLRIFFFFPSFLNFCNGPRNPTTCNKLFNQWSGLLQLFLLMLTDLSNRINMDVLFLEVVNWLPQSTWTRLLSWGCVLSTRKLENSSKSFSFPKLPRVRSVVAVPSFHGISTVKQQFNCFMPFRNKVKI